MAGGLVGIGLENAHAILSGTILLDLAATTATWSSESPSVEEKNKLGLEGKEPMDADWK